MNLEIVGAFRLPILPDKNITLLLPTVAIERAQMHQTTFTQCQIRGGHKHVQQTVLAAEYLGVPGRDTIIALA